MDGEESVSVGEVSGPSDLEVILDAIDGLSSQIEDQGSPETELPSSLSEWIDGVVAGEADEEGFSSQIIGLLTEIRSDGAFHPLMTTPFSDYSVLEGLLLLLVLWLVVILPCIRMLKGGFSWLLS